MYDVYSVSFKEVPFIHPSIYSSIVNLFVYLHINVSILLLH